jgi:hypothetical protein
MRFKRAEVFNIHPHPLTAFATLSHHEGRGRKKGPSFNHPVMLRLPPLQGRGIKVREINITPQRTLFKLEAYLRAVPLSLDGRGLG